MGEKTEKATPKKLRDARQKGQVAKAQDLPSAFTFVASFAVTLAMIPYLYELIGGFLLGMFQTIGQGELTTVISNGYMSGIYTMFIAAIPIMAFTAFIGCITTFLTVGPVFSTEVFKPDIKKFNPVENLKQKFKLKTLIELLKNLFKISLAAYVVYDVCYQSIPVLITAVQMDLVDALMIFQHFLMEVVTKLWVLFIVIAVADLIYQQKDFAKQMMMEKFEVKQEYKNTEGDPQIKSKRKQTAQEIAYSDGPSAAVQKGKAVVTNWTHLAIVLGYEKGVDQAPYILSMGKDEMAQLLVKLANTHDKPVLRNVSLARKLFEEGELYQYIPEDTFEVVAEIIRFVNSLQEDSIAP